MFAVAALQGLAIMAVALIAERYLTLVQEFWAIVLVALGIGAAWLADFNIFSPWGIGVRYEWVGILMTGVALAGIAHVLARDHSTHRELDVQARWRWRRGGVLPPVGGPKHPVGCARCASTVGLTADAAGHRRTEEMRAMGTNIDPSTGTWVVRIRGDTPVRGQRAQREVMFVRYFMELPLPFDVAEAALLGAPIQWVATLADDAAAHDHALLAEAGAARRQLVHEQVTVAFGPVFRSCLRTVLAMTWRPTDGRALSPALDADLEVGTLGRDRTQLSISARFQPDLDTTGRMLDRASLQRVAEATIKHFLDRVGQSIECLADSCSTRQP